MLPNDGRNMGLNKVIKKIHEYGVLVMFSHTIFSFSFALLAMLLAAGGLPEFETMFWIIVAFLGARTGANAINRVIDAAIDAKNPRTAGRQIPKGEISKKEVIIFTTACFVIFEIAAYKLNLLCFILSPIALVMMVLYSYTKRFTWACHVVLGITSAIAPVGAWIAVTGKISLIALILGAANCVWVAGFDIIYGAQDYEFDKKNKIHSIPAYFGVEKALHISTFFHIIAVMCLLVVGAFSSMLGILYFIGLGIVSGLLITEHLMVSPKDLKNVNIASYNINQIISITFLVFSTLDIFL